jgi:hypothetical protein
MLVVRFEGREEEAGIWKGVGMRGGFFGRCLALQDIRILRVPEL